MTIPVIDNPTYPTMREYRSIVASSTSRSSAFNVGTTGTVRKM